MAVKWTKSTFLGVRYREHATRKHGAVWADRCFSIRYKSEGKDKEEVVGWSSEGMTAEKAYNVLSTIRENIRLGVEPSSLRAMRLGNEQKKEEEKQAKQVKQKELVTLSEFWANDYLPTSAATKKASTIESEKWLYSKWIAPTLANVPLSQLNITNLEAISLHAQKAGKSPATIRYILAVCSQVWNMAAARNLVQGECPVRRIKKPQQDNRRMRFLTHNEATALLRALKERSQDMHDIALLSLLCGLRAGEIHSLTWGNVDLANNILYIRDTKNKKSRHAFIIAEVREMLERRYNDHTKNRLVFPSSTGKERRWVSDSFERTVRALGFNNTGEVEQLEDGKIVPIEISDARQRVVFHSLRHTFASWLVQEGTPLYTVAELMGHSTLDMTRRYSHLAPDTLRKAALNLQGKL